MGAPVYTYEIRDLASNALMETVPLDGAEFGATLCDSDTLHGAIQLPQHNSLGQLRDMYELTQPAHTCVYAYRDSRPLWGGIIWTSDYDSATGQIRIGAADWWSYFDHRKILPLLAPEAFTTTTYIAQQSTVYSGLDQNEIARSLVAQAQAHTGGDLGIVVDTHDSGFSRVRTYRGYTLSLSVGEALRNLTGVLDGPDIRFATAPPGADGKPVRRMLIGTPALGQAGAPWVWEYGANLTSYQWRRDGTRMRTRQYAVGEGSDQATPIGAYEDTTRYPYGWPLLEADATHDRTSGTTDTLPDHARSEQQIAGLPVVHLALTVAGNLPPTVAELSPGDDGRVIIEDHFHGYAPPRGVRGLDTRARIIKMRVKPGEQGETVTLTMAPLLDEVS